MNETEKNTNLVEVAKKQRYLSLIEKINVNTPLTQKQIEELDKYEREYKAQKDKNTQKKNKAGYTDKQQKFIDCYDGDVKKAAKIAEISYTYARQLRTKYNILEAIRNRQETEIRPGTIATRQQRQEFWTTVMNNGDEDMRNRLKASELLGKSEADFTEKLSHDFPKGCGVLVVKEIPTKEEWQQECEKIEEYQESIRSQINEGNSQGIGKV